MKAIVRLALESDLTDLQTIDPWPSPATWKQKVHNHEVMVLEIDTVVVGLLRYSVLWTTVPFLGFIRIKENHQKQGHSRLLLDFLKQHLRNQGFVALLSSSQTNEASAQSWHRHMGFKSNGIIENIADDDVGEIVYRVLL